MLDSRRPNPRFDPWVGLGVGLLVLSGFVCLSSLGFWLLGHFYYHDLSWTPLKCVYHVVITITTIGYGDVLQSEQRVLAAVATMALAFIGMGVPVFLITMLTTVVVESVTGNSLRMRRMEKRIKALMGHYVVCGAGRTGGVVVEELLRTRRPFVVVEADPERLQALSAELGEFLYVAGDATRDSVLQQAGIARAQGLIAALPDDRDNVFLTVSARQLNASLRIIARGSEPHAEEKLKRAGASSVVSINRIGGMRLVSESVRPAMTSFLDAMLRDREGSFRFDEIRIAAGAPLSGRALGEALAGARSRVIALALREPGGEAFDFNPGPEAVLAAGRTLLLVGPSEAIAALRARLERPGTAEVA